MLRRTAKTHKQQAQLARRRNLEARVGFEPLGPIDSTQLIDFNTRQKRQIGQIARIEVHGRYTALRYTITGARAVENNARIGPHRIEGNGKTARARCYSFKRSARAETVASAVFKSGTLRGPCSAETLHSDWQSDHRLRAGRLPAKFQQSDSRGMPETDGRKPQRRRA